MRGLIAPDLGDSVVVSVTKAVVEIVEAVGAAGDGRMVPPLLALDNLISYICSSFSEEIPCLFTIIQEPSLLWI